MTEDKLVPIYGKVSIYELPDRSMPAVNFWSDKILNNMFYEKNSVSIGDTIKGSDGDTIKGSDGDNFEVVDISFSFRDYLEDNSKGYDSKMTGPNGSDNLTVNVYLQKI